ncbi:MAG: Trk system potassium transporter TrkA, partial [Bacteroidota bacterium]
CVFAQDIKRRKRDNCLKINIIGAGEIGFYLAKVLSQEGHDLAVIDKSADRIARVNEHCDVMVLEGNGTSPNLLKQAGAQDADILIAVTSSDEVNLLACIMAHRLGTKRTLARVSNPEFIADDVDFSPQQWGIDLTIYPEGITAEEIVRIVQRSSATDVLEFEQGKVQLLGIRLDSQSPIINKKLAEVDQDYENITFRSVAIIRGPRTIIPTGDDTFKRGDHIYVMAKTEYIPEMLKLAGKEEKPIHDIMILGGGKVGKHIAGLLQGEVNVKLIESDKDKTFQLAEELENTLVIHGEGKDIDLLAQEGLMDMDAYVAATSDEETNIISCLMAKHLGVEKTIALIENQDYLPLAGSIGLDTAVNKKLSAANVILKFIRKGEIVSIATLHGVDAEVIELVAQPGSDVTKKRLQDLKFPKGALIGCVIHNSAVTIPVGKTKVAPNDRVVVFTLPRAIHQVEKLFSK